MQKREEIVIPASEPVSIAQCFLNFLVAPLNGYRIKSGMTGFLGLFNCFGGPILVINIAILISKETGGIIPDTSGLEGRNDELSQPVLVLIKQVLLE